MTAEERRTVTFTAAALLVASLIRFGWEARPLPPLFPPEDVPAELLAATREAVALEERRRTPLGPGERVDPNRDPEVELSRLPGVGPATAVRILASRDREGPFRRADDLLRVRGIGPATLARMSPFLDLDDPPAGRGSTGSTGAAGFGGLLDVNRAGGDELVALPGIGPALAERIVEYRRIQGPFRSPEDLLAVPGIGPATLERLRPLVRVGS
jgi:competence protein ComEA